MSGLPVFSVVLVKGAGKGKVPPPPQGGGKGPVTQLANPGEAAYGRAPRGRQEAGPYAPNKVKVETEEAESPERTQQYAPALAAAASCQVLGGSGKESEDDRYQKGRRRRQYRALRQARGRRCRRRRKPGLLDNSGNGCTSQNCKFGQC